MSKNFCMLHYYLVYIKKTSVFFSERQSIRIIVSSKSSILLKIFTY